MVEEALVGPHLLGLDWFEKVPPVVGERAGQVVLLITATEKQALYDYKHNAQYM